jgi:hypothetical protein
MFFLIISALSVAIFLIFLVIDRWNGGNENVRAAMSLCIIIFVFVLVIGFVRHVASYTLQFQDQADLQMFVAKENILDSKAKNLTSQFRDYLALQYPAHERKIFETISPKDIELYFAQYPEIRSNETILELVRQIRSLEDAKYDFQLKREDTLRAMRYRLTTPWLIHWFIPKIEPAE